MANQHPQGIWWASSFAAALPAAVLAAAGGWLGVGEAAGMALVGAGVAWLGLDLALLQPRLDTRFLGGGSLAARARTFLQHALLLRSVPDIALELESTLTGALGTHRCVLVAPAEGGGVRMLGGDPDLHVDLSQAEMAFTWLSDRGDPIGIDELRGLTEFPGAAATLRLLEQLGAEVILPLRHRRMLLGIVALGPPTRQIEAASLARFYRAIAAHATVALANTYLHTQAKGKGSLSRELGLATAIQEALLPDDRPVRIGDVLLRGLFRPVAECGGDLWSYMDLGMGRVLVIIADATGHGAAPAMLTAVARGGLDAARYVAGAELDPAQLLGTLNREIHRAGKMRYLMTAFAVVIDPPAKEIRFANAGQNFPYLVTRGSDGKVKLESLVARGNTLGSAAQTVYQTHKRPIAAGDRIILYTDGVVEAGSPAFEPFGEKRFRAALAGYAATPLPEITPSIAQEVDGYLAGRAVSDDITLVAIEVMAPDGGPR